MTCVKRRKTIRHWPYPISIFERVAILRPRRLEKTCNRAVGSECYRMHVICGLQSRHLRVTITSSAGYNHVISGVQSRHQWGTITSSVGHLPPPHETFCC